MEAAAKRGAPRRRMPGDRRRESILVSASIEFAERGYDGVRTAELAKSAGVSEALIYQHFDTKAELFHAALARSAGILQQRLDEARAPDRPVEERLERGLDAFLGFVADRQNAWAILVHQVGDPKLAAFQRELRAPVIGALADLLALDPRAKQSGLNRRQLEQLAEVITGGAEALAAWWKEHPKAKREELSGLLTSFVWSGFDRMVAGSGKARR